MNQLVTKSIRNANKFEINKVKNKFEDITNSVIKRDVYTVDKTDGYYIIKSYLTDKILIDYIPASGVAEDVCEILNAKSYYNLNELLLNVERYGKYFNECMCFKHSISSEKTSQHKEILYTRYHEAKLRLSHVETSIRYS